MRTDGVSVVIPARNGAEWLSDVLTAIVSECDGGPYEVLVVDDGSTDNSRQLAAAWAERGVRVVDGPRRGAAAAINAGVRASRFPFVAQIDQDVVVRPGWLSTLRGAMSGPRVAAAQGWYMLDPQASLPARVMAIDLEERYAAIEACNTDHVCTGNVLWRRAAIEEAGGLDETLGYGYDNDLSYRLVASGWELRICSDARSFHRWREDWPGYLAQQYGFGYGRLDLVMRHPWRLRGDLVSPAPMMAHPVVMLVALMAMTSSVAVTLLGGSGRWWLSLAALLVVSLAFERSVAAVRAFARFRDRAALVLPAAHLARDLAWVVAIVVWLGRRATGARVEPQHSMRPRIPPSGALRAASDE